MIGKNRKLDEISLYKLEMIIFFVDLLFFFYFVE